MRPRAPGASAAACAADPQRRPLSRCGVATAVRLDALFTQCAQVVLRRFAYRLPGFACTSLQHLQANVFAVPGSWDAEEARMQLTRPPLYPLLNLTGVGRGSITWRGPPVRNVRLEFNT